MRAQVSEQQRIRGIGMKIERRDLLVSAMLLPSEVLRGQCSAHLIFSLRSSQHAIEYTDLEPRIAMFFCHKPLSLLLTCGFY